MKIAVFGGAFDPPHKGHELVATTLITKQLADQVWFVPTKTHAFGKLMTPAQDRVKLLEIMLAENPQMHNLWHINSSELTQPGVSYTFQTLDRLSAEYPQHQFSFVIGSDNLLDLHKWGDAKGRSFLEMLAAYPFWVYPRTGYPLAPLYPGIEVITEVPQIGTSSTQVRELIRQKNQITYLVNPAIADYIFQHNLYQDAVS